MLFIDQYDEVNLDSHFTPEKQRFTSTKRTLRIKRKKKLCNFICFYIFFFFA